MAIDRQKAIQYVVRLSSGELSDSEKQELKEYVKENPAFRKEYKKFKDAWAKLDLVDETARSLYDRSKFSDPNSLRENDKLRSTLEQVSKSSRAFTDRSKIGKRKRRSGRNGRRTRRAEQQTPWKALGAAAAVLVAFLVGITLMDSPKKPEDHAGQKKAKAIAVLERTSPGLDVVRDGKPMDVRTTMKLRQDDRLQVPGGEWVRFRYQDKQTSVKLQGGTRISLRNENGTKRIQLQRGTLEADVEEQKPGQKVVATTPLGRAEIIGTKFQLSYDRKTRLEVNEGVVQFTSKDSGESMKVQKGEFGEIASDGTLSHGLLEPEKRSEPENKPPVANTGEDHEKIDRDGDGSESIPLDATASHDPDGTIAEYVWKKNDTRIASGKKTSVTLDKGRHTIFLEVTDDRGAIDRDRMIVNIRNAPRTKGLVGYWTFEEGEGDRVSDRSTYANHGIIEGNPTWTKTKDGKGVLRFDGDRDYVRIPHQDQYLLDRGTISIWFQVDRISRRQGIMTKEADGYAVGHLGIVINNGLDAYLQSRKEDHVLSADGIRNRTWHHVVLTWGEGGMKLFLDGKKVNENTYTGGLEPSSGGKGNVEPIVLGAASYMSKKHAATPIKDAFTGSIDEVRIYDRVLSGPEINKLSQR